MARPSPTCFDVSFRLFDTTCYPVETLEQLHLQVILNLMRTMRTVHVAQTLSWFWRICFGDDININAHIINQINLNQLNQVMFRFSSCCEYFLVFSYCTIQRVFVI